MAQIISVGSDMARLWFTSSQKIKAVNEACYTELDMRSTPFLKASILFHERYSVLRHFDGC